MYKHAVAPDIAKVAALTSPASDHLIEARAAQNVLFSDQLFLVLEDGAGTLTRTADLHDVNVAL